MEARDARLPGWLVAELRSDHAGETGAGWMYRAILRFARDEALREFALRHGRTEQSHLDLIEAWLPAPARSRLLPLWRLAGWMTGALPALVGPRAVYATIEAVESFVDRHYAAQIERLVDHPALGELHATLVACRDDELSHRDEAAASRGEPPGLLQRGWAWTVNAGSQFAVAVCRHV